MDAFFALSAWWHVGSDKGALWSPLSVLSDDDSYGCPRQDTHWQPANDRFVSVPQFVRISEIALAIQLGKAGC
jgi:hypothetical protein